MFESPEKKEQLPSQEEVKSAFETILKGKEYKEIRAISDERGLSIYEVEVTLEDGEKIELNFQTAKNDYHDKSLPAGGQFSASIHATYYDKDSMPYSGESVANYLDGVWSYTS